MKVKWLSLLVLIGFLSLMTTDSISAKDKENQKDSSIPNHVLNISKDNTFPNSTDDQEILEAEELTKELMKETDIRISNPQLIGMLNETTLKPSPLQLAIELKFFLEDGR
nr:YfkD family protein [Halobacillus salinarum]